MQNARLVSADSHVVEPADLWETRLDRKHRESAPKVVQKDGKWVIAAPGGIQFPVAGQFAAGMRGEELREHLGKGYEAGRPSGWDPTKRIADQETDGVTAEVLYTSNGLALFSLPDAELQRACFSVFNDWLAEYCSVSPKRLIGTALISLADIAAAVKELKRCAKAGLRGAMISNGPNEPYHSRTYDPFWQAASELGMPLSLHIITTSKMQSVTDFAKVNPFMMLFDWVHETADLAGEFPDGRRAGAIPQTAAGVDRERHRMAAIFPASPRSQPWSGRDAESPAAQAQPVCAPAALGNLPGRPLRSGAVQNVWRGQFHVGLGLSTSGLDLAPLARGHQGEFRLDTGLGDAQNRV